MAFPLQNIIISIAVGFGVGINALLSRALGQKNAERVNQVTPALYARFPTLEAFAAAEPEDVEPYVHSCGFYRAKARDIGPVRAQARRGIRRPRARHDGGPHFPARRRPQDGQPHSRRRVPQAAVVVDTHCIRLSNRMGLVDGLKDPVKIETALRKILPPEESSDFCHRLVLHGRAVCTARKPMCDQCCVRHVCQTAEEAGT